MRHAAGLFSLPCRQRPFLTHCSTLQVGAAPFPERSTFSPPVSLSFGDPRMALHHDCVLFSRSASLRACSVSRRRSLRKGELKSAPCSPRVGVEDVDRSQMKGGGGGGGGGEVYLPEEIWSRIFAFLPSFQSRCVARCVCRGWNAVLSGGGLSGREIWGEHSPVFFLDRHAAAGVRNSSSLVVESVGCNLRTGVWERLPPFCRPEHGRVAFVSSAGGIFCLGTSLEHLAVTLWNPMTGWSAELPLVKNFGMYYCRIYKAKVGVGRKQAQFTLFAAGLKSPRDYSSTATCVRVLRSGWSGWGKEMCLPDGCNVLVGSVNTAANPSLLYCLVEKSINLRAGMHLLARQRLAVFHLDQEEWISSQEIASASIDVHGKNCLVVPNCITELEGRMFGTAQLRQDSFEIYFILELVSEPNYKWKILAQNAYKVSDMCRQCAIAAHNGQIVFTQSSQCDANCAVDCSGLRTIYETKSGTWTELPHASITRLSPDSPALHKLNMESMKLCNGVFLPNVDDGPLNFAGLAARR